MDHNNPAQKADWLVGCDAAMAMALVEILHVLDGDKRRDILGRLRTLNPFPKNEPMTDGFKHTVNQLGQPAKKD